jgi:hypothetical protein
VSAAARWLRWLEDKSDWLSPLVVKEVRQVVRGREFNVAFSGCLMAGLAVAFLGAADALSGSSIAGRWTFIALISCLGFLGLAVVPLGAFNALRNERVEHTLELITLTALSARRVIVGKLLAQAVKLATLFAAMAPFIAMSFLLGGIDFLTILVSLVVLFLLSVWASALCLFLSTTFKSRAMSGLVFGAVGIMLFFLMALGRSLFVAASRGVPIFFFGAFTGGVGTTFWWLAAIGTTVWLVSLVNLILLAENRLSLPTEDSVTPLRVGFLVQFLLIVAWTMVYLNELPRLKSMAFDALTVLGIVHMAVVAVFAVTEELAIPRRVRSRMTSPSRWRWLLATFGPGGGRGAAYLLAQMVLLIGAVTLFKPAADRLRWLLAACGYICFFTGIPALAFRVLTPRRVTPLRLRVSVLIMVAVAMAVPDILHYVLWRPDILDVSYAARHLVNPFRTLANWRIVEAKGWLAMPFVIGLAGLMAQLALVRLGARASGETMPIASPRPAPAAGEPGRGDVLY